MSYKRKDELYKEHLTTIKGLKFTFREIDILACVVHNRGEKKIASMLSISPRTVSVHVYNAMNKIACNTKDQIIDFIEASGKLTFFREYYLHLLLQANFEKQLTYIANRLNQNGTTVYCYRDNAHAMENDLYQSIQKHLKLSRVKLLEITPNEIHSPIFELSHITEAGYYRDLLKNLLEAINPSQKEQIMGEFDESLQAIINVHEGRVKTTDEKEKQELHLEHNSRLAFVKNRILKSRKLKIFFLLLLFFIILLIGGLLNLSKIFSTNDSDFPKDTALSKVPTAVAEFEKFLRTIKDENFDADNSHPEKIKKNHSLVKKIEKIIDHSELKDVQEYLTKAEMPAEILMQYLYHLQALASYYMYNMQEGDKAQQLLIHAKDLAEKYVNVRGRLSNDFSQLRNEEIFAELNIIKDLPQMYTRVVYSLGRTYIYQKKATHGKSYFKLAEYLGDKLGLFEGYMSKINGLLVIEDKLAEAYFKEDNISQAIKTLHHIAQSSLILSNDKRSYIADYEPGAIEQKTIIPKENLYNLSICATRIIGAYGKIIQASKNEKKIQSYIDEINKYIHNYENEGGGFIKILDQLPGEKLSNICNKLGSLILFLWECVNIKGLNINDMKLKQSIIEAFLGGKIYDGNIKLIEDNLALAEKLFELGQEKSRNTEYTKVDSYKGLVATYQSMLSHTHGLLENQRHDLKVRINELKNKINLIENNKI